MEETTENLLRKLDEVIKTSINIGPSTAQRNPSPKTEDAAAHQKTPDENLDGTSKIWLIGDIGGGTKYFSNELMIGLARELRDQAKEGKAPDHIIFDGGIYPFIPRRVSKRGKDKAAAIQDGVNTLEDARESIKPHMTRIIDVIRDEKLGTTMHYILGPNDEENISNIYSWVTEVYNFNPATITKMIRAYEERTRNNEKTITERGLQKVSIDEKLELVKGQLKALAEQLVNLEEFKRLGGDGAADLEAKLLRLRESKTKKLAELGVLVSEADKDISKANQEMPDYCRLMDLYKDLRKLWIKEHPKAEADEVFEKFGTNGEMDEQIANEMAETREGRGISEVHKAAVREMERITTEMLNLEKDSDAYRALDRRFKLAQKLARSTSTAYAEYIKESSEMEIEQQHKETALFAGNITGTPELAKLADEISKQEVLVALKNAFGRRKSVEFVTKNIDAIRVGNIIINITNRPKNTSFNFTGNNDNELKRMSNMIRTDSEDSGKFRMILGAHSPNGRVFYVPQQNKSERYVCVVTAPFLMDIERIHDTFNQKRKDRVAEAYQKHTASSGMFEITVNATTSSHTLISDYYLKLKADEEKADELKRSIKILQSFNAVSTNRKINNAEALEIKSKMFSELNTELSNKLLILNGVDANDTNTLFRIAEFLKGKTKPDMTNRMEQWFVENMMPKGYDRSTERLDIVCISDAHVGGSGKGKYSSQEMLRGVTRYVAAHVGNRPYLLFLGGDNYEGGENHPWKHSLNKQILPENIELFGNWLIKNGMDRGGKEFNKAMLEFMQMMMESLPIQNVNKQVDMFIKCVEPVIKSADAIAVASGNHPNKGTRGTMDESLTLKMVIDRIVGHKRSENVIATTGEDVGMMDVLVNDFPVHFAHKLPRNFIKKVNPEQPLMLSGDRHEYSFDVIDGRVAVVAPQLSLTGTFVDQIGINNTDNLRGFALLKVSYGANNRLLKVTGQLITRQEMEDRGVLKQDPLIERFFSDSASIKMKKHKIPSVTT